MAGFSFDDLDTSVDRNSEFFKVLTAPLPDSTHTRPLTWPTPTLPRSPSQKIDISAVLESIHSKSSGSRQLSDDDEESDSLRKTLRLNEHSSKTLYAPSGRWEWIKDLPLIEKESTFLSDGAMCNAYIKKGEIGGKQITYVCKSWRTSVEWDGGFYLEMGLYKSHLRPLQGVVVPYIISLFTAPGLINVLMEPPHHSFWMEASADMPLVLKQRCVEAFEMLHAHGVLHGDVELRHMLIGGDTKVTLIDFQESGALVPIPNIDMRQVQGAELRRELRKVKVKLDYPGAREQEYGRFKEYIARRTRGEADTLEDLSDPPIKNMQEWNEWISAPGNDGKPKRFILPGQTPGSIFEEIQTFLKMIDTSYSGPYHPKVGGDVNAPSPLRSRKGLGSSAPSRSGSSPVASLSSFLPSGDRLDSIDSGSTVRFTASVTDNHIISPRPATTSSSAATGSIVSDTPASISKSTDRPSVIQPARFPTHHSPLSSHLSDCGQFDNPPSGPSAVALGKRKAEPDAEHDSRASKRRMLDTAPLNVSVSRNPTPSESSDVIAMKNLADCIANQLPHPTLLELFPNNPRWKQLDVQYYLKEQARDMYRTVEAAKRHPDRHFRMPRPIRGFGPLKRKMEDIHRILRGHYPDFVPINAGSTAGRTSPGQHENGIVGDTRTNRITIESNPSLHLGPPTSIESEPGWYGSSIHWLRALVRMWGEGVFL